MSTSIDQLQLNINAQANRANDALDRLVGKLERLSSSLGSLNTANLTSLANGVNRLAGAMTNMKNVGTADFTRLSKNIEKLASLNAGMINQAAIAIHQFANSLYSLNTIKVPETVAQLSSLANGIAQLGYKSSTQAITNIPKLAVAIRQLMQALSGAPKVSQNLIDMTNALANLSRSGANVGSIAANASKGFNKFSISSNSAAKSSFNLASAIGKLYAQYWMLIRVFRWVREAINISSDLTEVQNVIDVTFGQAADKIEKFADTSIEKFGMSELTLKKVSSRFQAMGAAMEIDNGSISKANEFLNKQTRGYVGLSNSMADVSITLTKLTADMASLYNVEQDEVAEDLQAIFTGQTKPLRQYGIDLTEATLKEWALKNGLDANIKSMTQAQKAMLRYQYVLAHSGAAHGDFERTVNTWANQTRILKQNIQQLASVIGTTFINAFKPLVKVLNNAMAHIINFVKVVSNSLGKIFGWTYEEGNAGVSNDLDDAAGSAGDIADGMGDAEKAAKKLKSHLLGIDELNVYEPDTGSDDGNGSGSGGGSGSGVGTDGQWIKTESILKMYESELDTLYKLGDHIGQAITKALNGIDWEKTYESARNFGKGLADFLNGLISPELFGAVGKTIAGSLNSAIYSALSFARNFDFHEFGLSLAAGVNEFFTTFDFMSLAKTFDEWVDGLIEALGTFLSNVKWTDVISGIGDFLGALELDTVAVAILAFKLKGNVKKLLGSSLLNALVGGITLETITLALPQIVIPGTPAFDVIATQILDWISEGIEKILPEWAFDLLSNMGAGIILGIAAGAFAGPAGMIAGGIIGGILGAITSQWSQITDWWDKSVGAWWKNKVAPWFTKEKWSELFENIKKSLKLKWDETVGQWSDDISKWWNENVAPWFTEEKWISILEPIRTSFKRKWDEISKKWKEDLNLWWDESVKPWFTVEKWNGILDNIKKSFQTKWSETAKKWKEDLNLWWDESVKPWFTVEKWSKLLENIKSSFKGKWSETSVQWGDDIQNWWNTKVKPWFTVEKWTNILSNIPSAFRTAFKNAANAAIDVFNQLIRWINNKLTFSWDAHPMLNIEAGRIQLVNIPEIPKFATGGFPEDGLFMANSSELVGKFSNGRTAVANNAQIVEGIEGGVERAVTRVLAPYLADIAQNTKETANKDFAVNIGDKEIARANERGRRQMGYALIT